MTEEVPSGSGLGGGQLREGSGGSHNAQVSASNAGALGAIPGLLAAAGSQLCAARVCARQQGEQPSLNMGLEAWQQAPDTM